MANMHVSEIGRQAAPPPVPAESNPVAEVSATLLRAQTFTGATGVGLLVREDDALICRAVTGTGAPDFGARIPLEGTFLGLCARSRKAERTEDAETDLRVENTSYGRVKPKSMLAVPVRSGADVVGVLAVFSTSASAFNNTHVAILRTISDAIVRIVTQLPALPAMPPAPEPAPEPPKKTLAETVIPMPAPAPKPTPVAAAPMAAPASETRVLKMPEPVKPAPVAPAVLEPVAAPTARKSDSELLTLADDPGPRVTLRTLPPLEKTFEPPKFTTQAPFFDLPRPNRRRRRMRNRIIAASAVVLFAATLGYGAYATRTQPEPKFATARPAVPEIFQEHVKTLQAKAPAATPAATVQTKELAAAAVSSEVIEKAVPEPVRTPSANTEIKPLAKSEKPAEVEAPTLALSATPAIPAIGVGLNAAKPELRQAQLTRPQLVQKVTPEYPAMALRVRASGEVKLTAVVRKDGTVTDVKVVNGHPLLRDSAATAVKQWRYYPGTLDGRAVESTVEIVLKFAAPK